MLLFIIFVVGIDEQDELIRSPPTYDSSADAPATAIHSDDDEIPSIHTTDDKQQKLSVQIKTETIDNTTVDATAAAITPVVPLKTGGRQSSAHIHLWQFLKELLASPQLYGTAIRWLDRSRGVFKIEDSVRVARLWGRRKNRPAMNYDKLSRSIRQYYKKGIMKKTERSQRLVYQFCTPYAM